MTTPTKRVPREPTREMWAAAQSIDPDAPAMRQWRAMWDAAPDLGPIIRHVPELPFVIEEEDAAPDADAGRVAELKRQLDASLAIAQLEHRIERALKTLTTPTMNLPGTTGGGFIGRAIAILRGEDSDA